jgi:hypothetical protein
MLLSRKLGRLRVGSKVVHGCYFVYPVVFYIV